MRLELNIIAEIIINNLHIPPHHKRFVHIHNPPTSNDIRNSRQVSSRIASVFRSIKSLCTRATPTDTHWPEPSQSSKSTLKSSLQQPRSLGLLQAQASLSVCGWIASRRSNGVSFIRLCSALHGAIFPGVVHSSDILCPHIIQHASLCVAPRGNVDTQHPRR